MATYQVREKEGKKFLSKPLNVGQVITRSYELGEIYYFRQPRLRPGFQPCQGAVIEDCADKYPEIWTYLQTEEGQNLCTTEEAWQAMTQATWGEGTFKASWDGIGGAPYFVQDLEAGTLRLPDLRGMFACAAGDGTIGPNLGGVMGDAGRNTTGSFFIQGGGTASAAGVFSITHGERAVDSGVAGWNQGRITLDSSRAVPTNAVNITRSWGALACVYLGSST